MAAEQIAKDRPEILYHYCSVSTFYNVIKNRSIWLSDISKSNDSEELLWFMRTFDQVIKQAWQSYLSERQATGKQDEASQLQLLYSEIEDILHSQLAKSWAFCLSEKRDDLGQWRGYADDGTGIAIGFYIHYFDAVNLNQMLNATLLDPNSAVNPHFQSVTYGLDALQKHVDQLKAVYYDTEKHIISPERFASMLKEVIAKTIYLSPFYKNDGFQEEKEWRLVFSMLKSDILQGKLEECKGPSDHFSLFIKDYGYIEKGSDLVSHVEFSSLAFGDAIAEILIGPKCKLTVDEVEMFLVASGLFPHTDFCNIKVSKSGSSYR